MSSSNYQNLTYGFDRGGNVTAITDAVGFGSRTFVYDDLNRLTQATGNFGPNQSLVTHDYAYDPVGNITYKAGVSYCYGYMAACSDPARPLALKSASDGSTFTYDNNGNTQSGGGRSYVWNVDNRAVSITGPGGGESMVYDYTGIRVRKIGNNGITYFPFTGYEVNGGVVTKYIRAGNEIIASKQGATDKRFYHNDHLGSVNVITNGDGLQQVNEYDPWGKVSRSEGNVDPNHRFTGQELDSEGNVHYYGGRYYNQDLGRFVSPDPFVQEPDNPQNLNRYSYVINNPQGYTDPSGYDYDPIELFFTIFAGSFLSGSSGSNNSGGSAATFEGFGDPVANAFFGGTLGSILGNFGGLSFPGSGGSNGAGGSGLGGFQSVLDAGGWLPGVPGIIATLGSAAVSFYQGDYIAGGIGVVAATAPLIGIPSKAITSAARGVRISEKGLALVEKHLARFERDLGNEGMIERLRDALSTGKKLFGPDANFYLHEAHEATFMNRGILYEVAHPALLTNMA